MLSRHLPLQVALGQPHSDAGIYHPAHIVDKLLLLKECLRPLQCLLGRAQIPSREREPRLRCEPGLLTDAAAAPALFARLEGQPMGKVVRMYADNKYHNFALYEWVEANAGWDLEIVRRPEGQRTSTDSTRLASPSPKCSRLSFTDRYEDWLSTS